jgi:hypothetical protein
LRASTTPPRGDCIDGETLAAWTEGRLRTDEAALVETHLADCARCQQLLATVARTAPPATSIEPLWRRWRLQWLVPIATAATVAAIWVAEPRQNAAPVSQTLADKAESPSNIAAGSATAATSPEVAPQPQAQTPAPQVSRRLRQDAATSGVRPNATSELAKRTELDRLQSVAPEGPTTAVQGKAETSADANARERQADVQARDRIAPAFETVTPTAPAAPPAATPAPPQAAAESVAVAPQRPDVDARSQARGTTASPSARAAAPASAPFLTARQSPRQFEIVSPTPAIRWRVVSAVPRRVERSVDGGGRWETLSMPTDTVFTAGASPAPAVCWIVGQAGTVVLTTDGTQFTRLPFPERVDLVSISATDDRHATVMSADGRTFTTEDQGKSWTR